VKKLERRISVERWPSFLNSGTCNTVSGVPAVVTATMAFA